MLLLQSRQQVNALWHGDDFISAGFPRVFYLKNHGYGNCFPLWALARYLHLLKQV